jgi:hypothetical protein
VVLRCCLRLLAGDLLCGGNDDVQARHEFDSPHGDAFTLLNLFDQWVKIKASKPRVLAFIVSLSLSLV